VAEEHVYVRSVNGSGGQWYQQSGTAKQVWRALATAALHILFVLSVLATSAWLPRWNETWISRTGALQLSGWFSTPLIPVGPGQVTSKSLLATWVMEPC
jgi:hypothetical protein